MNKRGLIMRWVFAVCLMLVAPTSMQALEICDELWLTRNLMYDKAGHCFSSPLGKAVFDNAGCKSDGVVLSEDAKIVIASARKFEVQDGCAVDTNKTTLAVANLKQRVALVDVPFPSFGESGCIGWQGERMALRTERAEDGAVIGAARKGDVLLFAFEDVDGWSFVSVIQKDVPVGIGWAKIALEDLKCDSFAG